MGFSMNCRGGIIVILPLAITALCLFWHTSSRYCGICHEFETALLSVRWVLLLWITVWGGSLFLLKFNANDLPLIGLLLIAIAVCFIGDTASQPTANAIIFLAGVTLGKGTRVFLGKGEKWPPVPKRSESGKSAVRNFLIGLVVLLAFSSWWHLDMTNNLYQGPRWMGLWTDPNIYGMLMGAGFGLAVGLLLGRQKIDLKRQKLLHVVLFIAAAMIGTGLIFSYSRGAWIGTVVGLLYMAKVCGRFKWRFVLPGIFVVAVVIYFFWHSTADTDSWYLKRLDLSRPSAQHRVAAWRGAFQIIRDHPFGVGWNNAVDAYEKNYLPHEGGAGAITMNSYLMLGTELGLPALVCFLVLIHLKFKPKAADPLQIACRAGSLVLLVAFWFDGGLFELPTAAVFWILLELGTSDSTTNKAYKSLASP
jgi:hypothetical protein